jgi:predicted AAA+ superfamily ATPase
MGILKIAPAERASAHLLIQLYGPPRSGKTYTALLIARGMLGPKSKIGVLDTESGRPGFTATRSRAGLLTAN